MQINNINTRILVGLGFVVGIIVMVGVILFLILPSKDKVQEEQPNPTPLVDTSPAPVKNTGELMKENKVVYVNISENGPEVSSILVEKGGVISFYNQSTSDVKLKITGSLLTEMTVKAGETVVSPVFRLRGEYKLEDLTSSKSAMITVK